MKRGLKLILCAVMATVLIAGLAGCSESDKATLNVYNWGEYIDMSIINDFEKEYGINVNYEMYETNEAMYQKIKSGGISFFENSFFPEPVSPTTQTLRSFLEASASVIMLFLNCRLEPMMPWRSRGTNFDLSILGNRTIEPRRQPFFKPF